LATKVADPGIFLATCRPLLCLYLSPKIVDIGKVETLPKPQFSSFVSLNEAASYLGVSKATLRNWDKEGKLVAKRHPLNKYRVYDLSELRALRTQEVLLPEVDDSIENKAEIEITDARSAKRIIAKLHNVIRDTDADSSILGRFDELTKLLFLKLTTEKNSELLFKSLTKESAADYASRIRAAYTQHAAEYPDLVKGKFSKLESSDKAIFECGLVLGGVSFRGANFDIKGVAYEEVIRNTFDKGDHQQFFTPHQVIAFIVDAMKPYLKGVVADPACGTAGFLAEVARRQLPVEKIVGLEIDERLAWVSGINLLLHGAKNFETRCLPDGGSLGSNAKQYFGKVDAILTNPPFGSDLSDPEVLAKFDLGKGKTARRRGILFIEQCYNLLKVGGVLAVIIDEGVLNLSSATDVRKYILSHFEILGIVGLPETAFMPYATVNASILILRKGNKGRNVFFGFAENIGRKPNGDDDVIYTESGQAKPNSDLPKILEGWESVSKGASIAESEQWYVADVIKHLKDDASYRLDFRYHHPSRFYSQSLLAKSKYPLRSLTDICDERNESIIPSQEIEEGIILYTGLANMEAGNGVAHQVPTPSASLKSAVKRYEPGDIIFAKMRPELRKVAIMNFREGGFASPECSIFVVRRDSSGEPVIDPDLLANLFRSDFVFGQLLHLVAGIGRPRLNVTDLRTVRIPVPPKAIQEASKQEFQGSMTSCRQLRSKAKAFLEEASQLEVNAVNRLAGSLITNES
jgi:type I restriction enzyme M protein